MSVVLRVAVWVAACLAFGSAAISLYWTAGGAWLLDTVGGSFERIGRERSAAGSGTHGSWSGVRRQA